MGIITLFWDDLQSVNISSATLWGLALALIGTLVASFGNMVSVRNSKCDGLAKEDSGINNIHQ